MIIIHKLKIVEEETDETIFWIEILEDSKSVKSERTQKLKSAVNEILAIIVQSIKTMKNKQESKS